MQLLDATRKQKFSNKTLEPEMALATPTKSIISGIHAPCPSNGTRIAMRTIRSLKKKVQIVMLGKLTDMSQLRTTHHRASG